ncbi:winged helix-turn-helix domain-containing protein [Streptomyces sp. GC420]|uniref:GntR family transcriptional regulator n=1 Tax=Streptomyces sp. GC420 TaxID=2697568 RepID=UPI001414E269|nr:winged helix-turn-helix domain-containing protein [Streptomyces sp. GC420]NBM17701.1 GntR family transcriptional regulator [Streptomyces sp. GC420]
MVVTVQQEPLNGGGRKPTYHEVADVLRERIRTRVYAVGTRMPTQATLADEFGVERGTIRQALKILQEEDLLTDVTRGVPATVADPAPAHTNGVPTPAEQPRSTMVALAPRITEAFTARHVRVDALSLTAESLMLALHDPIRSIHEGRACPEAITVRILLPSREIDLAFPVPVDDAKAAELHERWLAMRNSQGQVLRHNLQALRATHGIDVRVTFRALPFTPPVKLYILNGREALFAYYTITRREEQVNEEPMEMYDALGTQSLLFPFGAGPEAGSRDSAFVEQSQNWFDALWNTITSDLTLS